MNDAKSVKLVAVYGRVSTARQEEENTIETQLSAVRDHAAKSGYTIVKEYIDDGWSGAMLERPSLDQLRIDARLKLWDAVLIYDPDRLARRGFYQELVIDELEHLGIRTLFVTMPPVANDEDRLMFNVRGAFAEYERVKIAERFRLGKVRKARSGNIVASEAPYGYTLAQRKGKRGDADFIETHYEINEEEAKVVRMIFRLLADEGLTLRKIVRRLQDEKIRPRWSERGVWNTSTLSTLVRNKSYIGEGHYGASYAVVPEKPLKKEAYRRVKKTSRRMKPESEWIKVSVPAILEGEEGRNLFARAQEQGKLNFVLARRNRKNPYLLSGKIRCTCGCSRTGEGPQRGKHLYYRCSNRVLHYPLPRTCDEKGINARIADELVWSRLHGVITSREEILKYTQEWIESRNERRNSGGVDVEATRKELEKHKEQEDRYAKAYGQGLITLEKLSEYATPVRERIATLERQLMTAQTATQPKREIGMPDESSVDEFVEEVKALEGLSFEQKRAIVHKFVAEIVGTPSQLQVHGRVTVSSHVKLKTNNRYRRITERREVDAFQCANAQRRPYRQLPIRDHRPIGGGRRSARPAPRSARGDVALSKESASRRRIR